jgi:hypothetical protein
MERKIRGPARKDQWIDPVNWIGGAYGAARVRSWPPADPA